MQDIILDDWQEEIIKHDGNILLCTGRQVGKTLTFARKSAEFAINNPKSQPIVMIATTESQA